MKGSIRTSSIRVVLGGSRAMTTMASDSEGGSIIKGKVHASNEDNALNDARAGVGGGSMSVGCKPRKKCRLRVSPDRVHGGCLPCYDTGRMTLFEIEHGALPRCVSSVSRDSEMGAWKDGHGDADDASLSGHPFCVCQSIYQLSPAFFFSSRIAGNYHIVAHLDARNSLARANRPRTAKLE